MKEEKKLIPTYLPVWEQQYFKIKDLIKAEIEKPKKDRKKHQLRLMLKECKELRKLILSIKSSTMKSCPHCGGVL